MAVSGKTINDISKIIKNIIYENYA